MAAIGCRTLLAMLATLMALAWSCSTALAEDIVVGVNVVNPMRASVAARNAVFGQLEAAHVHVIRCGMSADDKGIDFAKRAAAQGIRIQLILGAQNPPNGKDGYYYAYCGRSLDHTGYVARASVADAGPGHWLKYFDGGFTQPGAGGDASNLGGGAGAPSAWLTTGETVKPVWVNGGLGLAFSRDRLHFTALPQPLMKLDNGRWDRKGPPNELLSYATLIDATTVENMLGDHWLMAYMYLQPNEGFDKRHLVFRPIEYPARANPTSRRSASC